MAAVPPPQWASRSRTSTRRASSSMAARAASARPLKVQKPWPRVRRGGWQPGGGAPAREGGGRDAPAVRGADARPEPVVPAEAGRVGERRLAGVDRAHVVWVV